MNIKLNSNILNEQDTHHNSAENETENFLKIFKIDKETEEENEEYVLVQICGEWIYKKKELIEADSIFFNSIGKKLNNLKLKAKNLIYKNQKKINFSVRSTIFLNLGGIIFLQPNLTNAAELAVKNKKVGDFLVQNKDMFSFSDEQTRGIIFKNIKINSNLENYLQIQELAKIVFNRKVINDLFDNIFNPKNNLQNIINIKYNISFLESQQKYSFFKKISLIELEPLIYQNKSKIRILKNIIKKLFLSNNFLYLGLFILILIVEKIFFNFFKKEILKKLRKIRGGQQNKELNTEHNTLGLFVFEVLMVLLFGICIVGYRIYNNNYII